MVKRSLLIARLRAVYDNQGEDGLKKDQRGPTGGRKNCEVL